MSSSRLLLVALSLASALPNRPWAEQAAEEGLAASGCFSKYCRAPDLPYHTVLNVKPRIQWDDAGGYCGSMAIQNVALGIYY